MKIALVFTPLRLEKNWTALKVQDEYVGIMPPISLAYVASIAERYGHEVIIIDAVAEELSLDDVISKLEDFSPDLLGFTITTYGFHYTLQAIKDIKEKISAPIVVGGWHLSLYPKETMTHQEIDYAITGEADETFPEFLDAINKGGSLDGIDGLAFRKNEEIIVTPFKRPVEDIDATPFPARHLLENDKYYNILSQRKNFTVMLSARGCPFRCAFCDLKTKKFRLRTPENFVNEIQQCYEEFNVREIDIYDSSFTVDKERVNRICQEIQDRGLDVSWTVRTRADCVNKDLLETMKRAGCSTVMYGIESGNPEILKRLHKGTDLSHIRDVVEWTSHLKMKSLGFFMIGSPGETVETAKKTIKFSTELDLDYVQFTKTLPLPNTELYDMYLEENNNEDYWSKFTLDKSYEKVLPLVATDIKQEEALGLLKKAYVCFYFRPKYILKALKRLKSFLELKNSVKAALGILLSKQHAEGE